MERADPGRWEIEPSATEIDEGLWLIDAGYQGRNGIIAAYLLAGNGDLALIETGPTSTLPNLLAGIEAAGFDPADLTDAFVTHIHLDHAGAAGALAAERPGLRVHVHPIGAPHMVDPSRLLASAARIYGDRMDELWGETSPVPEAQIVPFEDGQTINVAGRTLQVIFTPGHASHHVVFWDSGSDALFMGDLAGARMPGHDFISATVPPPEVDRDLWAQSIARLQPLRPQRLYLTHYGAFDDGAAHLDRIIPVLDLLLQRCEQAIAEGADRAELTSLIHEHTVAHLDTDDPEVLANYEWAMPAFMGALGVERYFKKRAQRTAESGTR